MNAIKQRGVSMVELMVSITIGLILLAGVMSIFFSSKVTYFANEKTARLQENGRVALDLVLHDMRASGYMGCARSVPFTSMLNTPNSMLWNYAIPLQGYESDGLGTWSPAIAAGTLSPAPVARERRRRTALADTRRPCLARRGGPGVASIRHPRCSTRRRSTSATSS